MSNIEYTVTVGTPTTNHDEASTPQTLGIEYTAFILFAVTALFVYVYIKVLKYIRKVYLDKVNALSWRIAETSIDVADAVCRTWSNKERERGGRNVEYCTYCYGDKTTYGTKSFIHDEDCPVISALEIRGIVKEMRHAKSIR